MPFLCIGLRQSEIFRNFAVIMDKQDSQILKGVAILLMIFYHLFNREGNVDLCTNLIYIGSEPLVSILARASNPVAFYLILGGYGLYCVWRKGDKNRYARVIKLVIHYWLTLAIFVTIGHMLKPEVYPGSWLKVLSNVTCYQTTYNGEMWFLLPYLVLSLSAPYIFRFYTRFKARWIVAATLLIYIATCFCISRYGASFLYHNYWIYNPLLVLHLLFNFSLGALAARADFFGRMRRWLRGKTLSGALTWGGVIALVTISCVFKYNFFYAFGVISCLACAPMGAPVKRILCKLGDQSMNMWMVHSWFCYYLFKEFIYSFSYPLLIFAVLTVISYICSLMLNRLARPIESLLLTRAQIAAKPML